MTSAHAVALTQRPLPARESSLANPACFTAGFALPGQDLGELLGRLGCKLLTRDHALSQYLAWSTVSGLFDALDEHRALTTEEASVHTSLNERGADALLGVLCALGLATRSAAGQYSLTGMAQDYFLTSSPFFIGDQLRPRSDAIPRAYLSGQDGLLYRLRLKLMSLQPEWRFGSAMRLRNQHARNLFSCTAAVRTGEFSGVRCLVDVAGGSGTFSIPLALESPVERIVLAELPQALPNVRPFLAEHGVENRVEVLALDIFHRPWPLPPCDGLFMGNFLHGFSDSACQGVCREAFERLSPGGRIWIHEMIWNANKDGPLITAMFNAAIRCGGQGRQRTAQELIALLLRAGFAEPYVVPTTDAFALVAASKPRGM